MVSFGRVAARLSEDTAMKSISVVREALYAVGAWALLGRSLLKGVGGAQ